jgi:BirA family transcriptional regulator, biotin operon repressor / biotin---[acetyl-CoA-carboxylase] ligase
MPLLERLRSAAGTYVPFDQLEHDSVHVQRDVADLVEFGFGIEHHPHHGIAYRHPADRLCPDQLEFQLDTRIVGRRIAVWNRVASTNDVAMGASRSRANNGLVILAEEQTAGRGRRGRDWIAPARSSILMSVLLFPPAEFAGDQPELSADTRLLTALAAVAVAETVELSTGLNARIKWPNDVRVNGRKIAGILVERPAPVQVPSVNISIRPAIIGIGLNVNVERDHFPSPLADVATSLQVETPGHDPLDRSQIARDVIRSLDRWYNLCLCDGMGTLSEAWSTASEHLGQTMRVETHDRTLVGVVSGLDLRHGLALDDARVILGQDLVASANPLILPLESVIGLAPSGDDGECPSQASGAQQHRFPHCNERTPTPTKIAAVQNMPAQDKRVFG